MIRGVDSVVLYVKDVGASLHYYRDLLGFSVIFVAPDEDEGGVAGLKVGTARLILHSDQETRPGYLPASGVRGRGVILHFEVDDVDRYHADLVGRGVEISLAPTDESWGARAMYLYDPDGYNISFIQRASGGEGRPG
ncbi:MAG: VOC family protein [Armatimonadetes bacterium]|nr:VOC family protein [Armatimonadota bacterium]